MNLLWAPARGIGFVFLVAAAALCHFDGRASQLDGIAEKAKLCDICHGEDGVPVDPDVPIIAGQQSYYLYVQLKDYKSGLRASPVMSRVTHAFNKEELRALGKYFAEKAWPYTGYQAPDSVEDEALKALSAGQCVQCHLGGYEGDSAVPRLAGQQRDYLERTMLEFKRKVRLNAPAKSSLFKGYEDDQIAAMASYLGGL